jgi:SAM-dependent methyltransferase
MMFLWQPKMVSFMKDACENNSYNPELTEKILRHLPQNAYVCDAGCGLGYLSLEMAKHCAQVRAVDISSQALEVLKKNVALQNRRNISVVEGDILGNPPEKPYDAMVFSLFGGIETELKIAKAQCNGNVILIKKNWNRHMFSLGNKPLEHNTLPQVTAVLHSRNIRFTTETFDLEMGQPFRTLPDAVGFFRTYSRDGNTDAIREEDVKSRLIPGPSEEFPFYFPAIRHIGMIVLDSGDIPDDIYEIQVDKKEELK